MKAFIPRKMMVPVDGSEINQPLGMMVIPFLSN